MWTTLERVSVIGGAIAVIGIALTIGWYVLDLEWRVRSLEARLLVATASPQSYTQSQPSNPLDEACKAVSEKLSEAIEPVGFGARVDAYKEQLKLLACDKR